MSFRKRTRRRRPEDRAGASAGRCDRQAAVDANPFRNVPPARVGIIFLPNPPPKDFLAGLKVPGREELHLSGREIFIHYPDGMGRSKLKLPPPASEGTTRNLNTLAKLVAMTRQ